MIIRALGVSRGVHNIAFSVSPDVVKYFHLTPLPYYYKRPILQLQEALSFSWNIFPDYFKFNLSSKEVLEGLLLHYKGTLSSKGLRTEIVTHHTSLTS